MGKDENVEEKLEEASALIEKAEELADTGNWSKVAVVADRAKLELGDASFVAYKLAKEKLSL